MLIAVLKKLLPKTIEKVNSPKNGEISVIEQFGRRKIVVGKLTQSGPVMEEIWREAVKVLSRKYKVLSTATILVLGLGGGSITKVLKKHFSNSKITAVDYDPIMVNLGKKYLGFKETKNLRIIIGDAEVYFRHSGEAVGRLQNQKSNGFWTSQNDGNLFDLIFVDLFSGDVIPKKTETEIFLRRIKVKLTENGLVVFNRHYYQNHIFEAKIFLDKLKKIFNDVRSKKILTNLLIFAKN